MVERVEEDINIVNIVQTLRKLRASVKVLFEDDKEKIKKAEQLYYQESFVCTNCEVEDECDHQDGHDHPDTENNRLSSLQATIPENNGLLTINDASINVLHRSAQDNESYSGSARSSVYEDSSSKSKTKGKRKKKATSSDTHNK